MSSCSTETEIHWLEFNREYSAPYLPRDEASESEGLALPGRGRARVADTLSAALATPPPGGVQERGSAPPGACSVSR
eukprot:scaffold2502_cov362-Prasinococcus_capsulatus_cf.AAC.11